MSLKSYKEKRSFRRTPEPTGGAPDSEALTFVIQKHQATHLHYDCRLELRGVLKSWAVPKGPSTNPEDRRLATHVEDHPFDYKNFEGIIPKGNYGAGTVIIWDEGTYKPINSTGNKKEDEKLLLKQYYSGKISIILKGKKLKGLYHLVKTSERSENAWLLYKGKDAHASKSDILKKDKSVVSKLSIKQMAISKDVKQWKSNRASKTANTSKKSKIKNADLLIETTSHKKDSTGIVERIKRDFKKVSPAPLPHKIEPMYASLVKEPFNDADWEFEIKWDGYRTIAFITDGKVSLKSRSNQSFNYYTPVVSALQEWGINAVLDGEIVILNEEGKSDFSALQVWKRHQEGTLVYYVFDILWMDGIDLTSEPLSKRKDILKKILPDNNTIRFSDSVDEVGVDFFDLAKKNQLEGIIAKKKSSKYEAGKRSKDWLKITTSLKQEFVIGGWTESSSGRTFKSILFGYCNDNGELIYFGHAGHGFKEKEMPELLQEFKKREIKKSPFANEVDRLDETHFMKPELVGAFEYKTTTSGGKIRHPAVFKGFRTDKTAAEVKLETPIKIDEGTMATGRTKTRTTDEESNWPVIEKQKITSSTTVEFDGKEVVLTNVENALWGDFTKAHLLMYYHGVYPYIIPYLKERPLSLHIKHLSPTAPGLYIKDMEGRQPEWAEIFSIKRKHKKKGRRDVIDYLVCNDEATLQYIINLGCIDVNPWTSRTTSPESPDYIIIDLDPSDNDYTKVIETAKAAKELFDKYKIKAYPKTSGKTGMHLYLPVQGFSFSETRTIAENICTAIHELIPDTTTTEVSINLRGDKLYIDANQNDFADTVAAPYSVRPYYHPTVSTPLEWKEINNKLDPLSFNVHSIVERLQKKGDLFQGVLFSKNQWYNSKILKKFL